MRSLLFSTLLGLILLMSGCSAAKKIAGEVVKVHSEAASIRSNVNEARQNLDAGNLPAVSDGLTSIDGHAVAIQASTDIVQQELTQVQDKTPAWVGALKWVGIAVSVIGVIFLLWRFNLLLLAESIIQRIVSLIAKWLGA